MSDPAPRPKKPETYTEEMQRWMSRQSVWWRLKNFRRHPDARPVFVSFLVLAGWMLPAAAVAAFGFYVVIHRYTGGPKFGQLLEQEAGEYFGLTNTTSTGGQWKAGAITLTGLAGEGNPGGFVRSFKTDAIRFESSFRNLFAEEWTPANVLIQGLEIEFRGGLLGPEEARSLALVQEKAAEARREKILKDDGDPGPYEGFWGIHPSADRFKVQQFQARNSTIRWGLSARSEGSLAGCALDGRRLESGDWRIACKGGKLTVGWFRSLDLDEAVLIAGQDTIRIERAAFRFPAPDGQAPDKGQGTLTGSIGISATPTVDLAVNFQDVEINRLLPAEYQRIFSGKVNGKAALRGLASDENGLASQVAMEFLPGFGFGMGSPEVFPVLEVLGGEAVNLPVRYFEASGGGMSFTIAERKLRCPGANLQTGDGERLEGTFDLDLEARSIKGAFRIGVKPISLKEHPRILEKYFREETAGLRWMTLPMEGPLSTSTLPMAEGLRAALKQEAADRLQR
jgi:hypothetical protein